jgi:hypothetical protein
VRLRIRSEGNWHLEVHAQLRKTPGACELSAHLGGILGTLCILETPHEWYAPTLMVTAACAEKLADAYMYRSTLVPLRVTLTCYRLKLIYKSFAHTSPPWEPVQIPRTLYTKATQSLHMAEQASREPCSEFLDCHGSNFTGRNDDQMSSKRQSLFP